MIKFGSLNVKDIRISEHQVKKVAVGSEIVWEKNASPLPSGYTEVKYLEIKYSTKNYIDTLFYPSNNSKVWIKCHIHYWSSGNLGCAEGFQNRFSMRISNTTSGYIYCNMGNRQFNATSLNFSATYDTVEMSKDGVYFNDVLYEKPLAIAYYTSIYSYFLFAYNDAGTISNAGIMDRIYACKLWENDELQRDFIPCLDTNNVPCFYDTVTQQTFYNQGTGTFGYETMDGTVVAPT